MTHSSHSDYLSGKQARELLQDTTPGPWVAMDYEHALRSIGPIYGDSLAAPEVGDGYLVCSDEDADLAAAAPALAETVAWLYERIREIHNDQRCWADAYRAPIEWDPEGKDPARLARAEAHDDCADMLATLLDDEEARP